MKVLSLAFLLTIITGCASAQKAKLADASIEYRAVTRGSHMNVNLWNDTLSWYRGRGMAVGSNYRVITAEEKETLVKLLSKVDLAKLKDLKAPTDARLYDGAMIANIKVVTKDSTYESNSFDHGKPPAEIADFVSQFLKFTGDETIYGN